MKDHVIYFTETSDVPNSRTILVSLYYMQIEIAQTADIQVY